MANYCFWLKIVLLSLFCALNLYLFILSCGCNYQDVVAREHIKFRQEMPTMDSWINSPFGKLKSYLFNVTNADDFLSGKDSKVRLEQVGPITYHILGYNDIINRTKDSVTYNKHRYRHVKFMPEESVSPDILNKTIVQFNSVLLGAAAQTARSYISITTIGFDAVTVNEPLFLSDSIYYFLWEFTRPSLQVMSQFLPLSSNCGPLHNALKEKEEIFKVNIGTDHGVENFFRIQTLNDEQLIKEQSNRIFIDDSCPINVEGTHDNSLFPPNIKKNTSLNIVASESCRILPLHYQREEELDGISGYRYALLLPNETAPECLSVTNGVRLPKGMFDVSKCVINDAPAAFSMPHFYGSSYDWTEHFDGLNPNAEEHEGYILLEPTTGIPIKENYRFQSNTIMPNMRSYSQPRLKKLSYMIVPTFWYEFELDRLPGFVTFLIRLDVKVLPVLQPVFMALMLLGAAWSLYALIRLRRQLCHKICTTDVQLETVLNQHPQAHPTSEHVKE